MYKKAFYTLIILFIAHFNTQAQVNMDSTVGVAYLKASFGLFTPANDMANRFGNNSTVGGELGIKTKKNYLFAFKMEAIFGGKVLEPSILESLTNEFGQVVTKDGQLTPIITEQRGYNMYVTFGKLFNFNGKNKNSGLLISAGAGFLQHRINLDYRDGEVLQLSEQMERGYDRLTNGFSINQFIGYQYFGKNRLINFYAGFEGMQAWTKSRRAYNYDLKQVDDQQRLDALYGIRFGWIIPFYKRSTEEFYYY